MDYVEVAMAEYYRNLGIILYKDEGRAYFDTATVKVTMGYKASARLDDLLDVYARVARIGNTSLTVETEMYSEGLDDLLHKGEFIYVNYDSEKSAARPVPNGIRTLIRHFEETGEVLPLENFPELVAIYNRGSY